MDESAIKIIDDFLPLELHQKIKNHLLGFYFPWYFNSHRDREGDGAYQFTHLWIEDGSWTSSVEWIVRPIIDKLDMKEIWRIKANLQPKDIVEEPCMFHIDNMNDAHNLMTGIYYVTNGGYTEIAPSIKIDSIENRMVVFPGEFTHRGSTSLDHRCVINFNWRKEEIKNGN